VRAQDDADVILDIPQLHVEEITLEVADLAASVSSTPTSSIS
jgi:hypothetical protein